jgi:hypothetical protein
MKTDWEYRSEMKAVLAEYEPIMEPVEGRDDEAKVLNGPSPEFRDVATQTPGDSTGKKRRLGDMEGARPQDQELNPLESLIFQMQQMVDAHQNAKEEFKKKIDSLALEVLALKKF